MNQELIFNENKSKLSSISKEKENLQNEISN